MFIGLIISAFMVVNIKYSYKLALNKEQALVHEYEKYLDQWRKILIEYNTLTSPSYIDEFSSKRNMHLPNIKEEVKIVYNYV